MRTVWPAQRARFNSMQVKELRLARFSSEKSRTVLRGIECFVRSFFRGTKISAGRPGRPGPENIWHRGFAAELFQSYEQFRSGVYDMAARLSSGPEILGLKIGAQSARPLEFYIRNSAWITGWNSVPYSFQSRFPPGAETPPGDCSEARRIRSNYVVPTLVSHFSTVS